MSIANLTPTQLREAADLLEKIAQLQNQLEHLHGSEAAPVAGLAAKPAKRKMTAAHIAKIRAAQKLRWAKVRAAKTVAAPKPAAIQVQKGPKKMSAEARAKIAAAQKARWAKVNAAKGKPAAKLEVAVKSVVTSKPAAKPAPVSKPAKKTISPEGIARIKAAQKARWAKIKAAKAGKK
jgi:hypothetical protein